MVFWDMADTGLKKKVEDVMPIATGHEREELEASLEGKDILDINHPVGPFGTKLFSLPSPDYPYHFSFMLYGTS
ncbi:cytochrome c oxidase subunit 5b-2 [Cucumis melo var. makuwa]|uniref:Cytochrome c oxidase subunit 5b-2 n=1 Tax=Cucumis melo var. makuwa TaxID=1194695 RepID=A0A5A7SQF0_CUCMM|nr:cytochrome c oxidase subunit 5b-2 [Cucumis melo var. makuwa]